MRTRDDSKNDERLMWQNTNDKLRDGSVMISPSGFDNRRSAFMFYEQVSMDAWSNWPNPHLSDAWHKWSLVYLPGMFYRSAARW